MLFFVLALFLAAELVGDVLLHVLVAKLEPKPAAERNGSDVYPWSERNGT